MLILNYEHPNGTPARVGVHISYHRPDDNPHPTHTELYLYPDADANKHPVYGVAYLHPNDTFCRTRGRKLAFERAVENFTTDPNHRAALWAAFMSRVRLR